MRPNLVTIHFFTEQLWYLNRVYLFSSQKEVMMRESTSYEGTEVLILYGLIEVTTFLLWLIKSTLS